MQLKLTEKNSNFKIILTQKHMILKTDDKEITIRTLFCYNFVVSNKKHQNINLHKLPTRKPNQSILHTASTNRPLFAWK